jgi:hypothetical protein
MAYQTFSQIRALSPDNFLVLIDCRELALPDGRLEILGAEDVSAFKAGEEMMKSYSSLSRAGKKVRFCTPDYRDSFIIERIHTMRKFGTRMLER